MIRLIETIVVLTLLSFSFFAGVKYSDQVKEFSNWLFEAKEVEEDISPSIMDDENLGQDIIDKETTADENEINENLEDDYQDNDKNFIESIDSEDLK